MYKTTAEVEATRKDLITVEMNAEKDNVDIYVRNARDCRILNEAHINLSPEGFIEVMYPIMQAKGYRLIPVPEAF